MELVFELVGEFTGSSGVTAAVLVGIVLALVSCGATLFLQWVVGR